MRQSNIRNSLTWVLKGLYPNELDANLFHFVLNVWKFVFYSVKETGAIL